MTFILNSTSSLTFIDRFCLKHLYLLMKVNYESWDHYHTFILIECNILMFLLSQYTNAMGCIGLNNVSFIPVH